MYWTTHVAVGMALGSKSRGALSALVKGLASHFILDTVPHYDFNSLPLSLGDLLLGLSLQSSLNSSFDKKILMGALGAGLPDIEGGLVYFGLLPKKHAYFHKYSSHPQTTLSRALFREILIIISALIIVKREINEGRGI